jgi:hypothetical protein
LEWLNDAGRLLPGTLFGGSDAKYVVANTRTIYVINTEGEVWAHEGWGDLSGGNKLNGPSLFGGNNDKYVLLDDNRILIINTLGEIWAHDLICTNLPLQEPPPLFTGVLCGPYTGAVSPDAVGGGYKLNGPSLFGATNDKYVVLVNELLLVINTSGDVWARSISGTTVSAGYKLSGPRLFGGPDDRYVVVYEAESPPR